MKWIGQHIVDLIARFRSDVYLEDISTGTIASGGNLGLDSNNKIVKAVDGGGDLTSIVAGTGLSGTDLTGPIPTLNVDASQPTITTLAGVNSLGVASATTNIAAGDLTMYNNVNDGNPTFAIGSSDTNKFEIKTAYNSGAQTLDEVYFNTYTTSSTSNDGRYIWQVDEVELARLLDAGFIAYGYINAVGDGAFVQTKNSTASSATEGGKLKLVCDDGAAMADDHRLGVIEFQGAEDASSNRQTGASIQAMCDAAWSASENGTRLEFYTMDGNASSELSLTLDSDLLATFTGAVTVTGALTGTLATASQTNITGVGTITTGVWQGTDVGVAHGGTGASTLGIGQVLVGNGTGSIVSTHLKFTNDAGETDTSTLSILSNQDLGDKFTIGTTTHGATTLTTVDDDATAAHFEIAADGDITLDSAGQIKLEPVAGNNILLDGTIAVDAGVVTGATSITSTAFVGTLSTASQPNITGVGTIDTGVWNGDDIPVANGGTGASNLDAFCLLAGSQTLTGTKTLNSFKGTGGATVTNILDEDAMGSDSATALATQQSIKAYVDTRLHYIHTAYKANTGMDTERYVSLVDADREATSEDNVAVVAIIPATGVLKRVIVNSSSDLSGKEWTYKLKRIPSGTAYTSEILVATVVKDAGGASNTNSIVDFVTDDGTTNDLDFESGYSTSTQITAGDRVLFSVQANSPPSGQPKMNLTLVFEIDDATVL